MTLSASGIFNFYGSQYNFNSNSDSGSFHIGCEDIYFGDEHCDTIRLGDLSADPGDTTIQLYGDIVARNGDVSVTGDVSINGDITVNSGGSLTTPSISTSSVTIGSSNDNSTLSYSSVDSIIDVNTGMRLDGELQADNIWLANNGGITIGSDTGFTGTLALGGGTLTFKGGILVDTTLSTV